MQQSGWHTAAVSTIWSILVDRRSTYSGAWSAGSRTGSRSFVDVTCTRPNPSGLTRMLRAKRGRMVKSCTP